MNYTKVNGRNSGHKITLFALSTCPHCNKTKKYLEEKAQTYSYINVDQATREEKREITNLLRGNNLPLAFPVLIIDETILQGFDKKDIDELIEA